MKKSIGIIGFGSFGQFMAKHLENHFKVLHFDPNSKASCFIEKACQCNFLILCVPAQVLEETLITIKDKISIKTVVIDVCSIKCLPLELMQKYLPDGVEFLCTHPLFGPKSGANGIEDLNIAICEGRISNEKLVAIRKFLIENLKLNVIETTANEHDSQMAYVQGLTHFIAKGLSKMDIPENLNLKTATFEHLIKLKEIVGMDSEELYKVIQNLNPHTKKVRKLFLDQLSQLDSDN
jgi:prephenate dehydrogenase